MESRSGLVALVGRPNVGKSTLLNALIGQKIAIVSPKPQTTRNRIVGILTEDRGQAVFFDLPGVHKPMHGMNRRMMREVKAALSEADLLLHMVDASASWGSGEEYLANLVSEVGKPVVGLLNKIDLVKPKSKLLPLLESYGQKIDAKEVIPISALYGDGLDEVRDAIFRWLPEGPPLYPPDVTTAQTERFFVAEVIREKLLAVLRDELPYTTGVLVDSFSEEPGLLRIEATILVERPSQKPIVLGRGGSVIKQVGTAARKELEAFFGTKIYLGLRVKVHKHWREDPRILARMEPGVAHLE